MKRLLVTPNAAVPETRRPPSRRHDTDNDGDKRDMGARGSARITTPSSLRRNADRDYAN